MPRGFASSPDRWSPAPDSGCRCGPAIGGSSGSLQLQAGRHLSGLGQLAARVLGLLAHQFKAVLGGPTAYTRRGARTTGQGADCSNPAAVAGGKGAGARVGTTPNGGPLEGVGCGASQGGFIIAARLREAVLWPLP